MPVYDLGKVGEMLEIYSLDETRVGTWINGKPLYQKTIICYITKAKQDFYTADDVDELCEINGIVRFINDPNNPGYSANHHFYVQDTDQHYYIVTNGADNSHNHLTISIRKEWLSLQPVGYITIKYTKTGDIETTPIDLNQMFSEKSIDFLLPDIKTVGSIGKEVK